MRNTDKVRLRWTLKPSEINWRQFVEGKHLANHLSNSSILTNKFKLLDLLVGLHKSMLAGAIQSEVYRSPEEFTLETFCLSNNTILTKFLQSANTGLWVLKNTSTDTENGITLV